MNDDRRVDLRLAPSAALVWLATALGYLQLGTPLHALLVCALLALLGALVLIVVRTSTRTWAIAIVVAALSAVLASTVAQLRWDAARASPLTAAAEAGQLITVTGTVDTRPREVGDVASGPTVILTIATSRVEIAGDVLQLHRPVLVLAPSESWRELIPGSEIAFSATGKVPRQPGEADAVVFVRGPPEVVDGPPAYQRLAAAARLHLTQSAHTALDADTGGLLVALTTGETAGISDVTSTAFRDAGLSHLLAVSGANVAIVIGALIWLMRRIRIPFAWQIAGAGAGLLSYVVITGPEPSVLRAAGMGVVLLAGLASGRPRSSVPALCATIIVLVTALPALATSIGFALSVAATAGIVLLSPVLIERWDRLPRWLSLPLAVSTAAGLITIPILILLYPVINLGSLVANLLAAPAVAPATVLGILATATAPWLAPVSVACCFVAGFFVRWIELIADLMAQSAPWQLRWPAGVVGLAWSALAVVIVVLLLAAPRRWRRWRRWAGVGAVLLVVGAVLLNVVRRSAPPQDWVFAACDVGQGDAILARAGPTSAVLIDTGPDDVLLSDCLDLLGIDAVPMMLLTHFHADHVSAADAVLGHRPVASVVTSPRDGAKAQDDIEGLAAAYGATVTVGQPGASWHVGDTTVEILGPVHEVIGSESDANNNSLIARITVEHTTMLITGDAEIEEQEDLLPCGCLAADVLKVPHHGSATQDPDFIEASGAPYALVSAGIDNDYGHPAASTVDLLRSLGMDVWVTSRSGTIVLSPAGDGLSVTAYPRTRPAET